MPRARRGRVRVLRRADAGRPRRPRDLAGGAPGIGRARRTSITTAHRSRPPRRARARPHRHAGRSRAGRSSSAPCTASPAAARSPRSCWRRCRRPRRASTYMALFGLGSTLGMAALSGARLAARTAGQARGVARGALADRRLHLDRAGRRLGLSAGRHASSDSTVPTRILIVEDDRDIADLVARYLERAGFVDRRARPAAKGSTAIAEKLPDLDRARPDAAAGGRPRSLPAAARATRRRRRFPSSC